MCDRERLCREHVCYIKQLDSKELSQPKRFFFFHQDTTDPKASSDSNCFLHPHVLIFLSFVQHGCDHKSFGIDVAKLAGVPSQVETRAREILNNLEQNDNIFEDTFKIDRVAKRKKTKPMQDSAKTDGCQVVALSGINRKDAEVENELTKAILLLNPESLTPRKALEIIYDLQAKAWRTNS